MENDFKSNLIKNELENEKIFNLDYENQKLENNKEYEKWKKSMIKYYGNDANLFRCLEDKILFFNENNRNSDCFIKCPICNKYICCYCPYSTSSRYFGDDQIKCCLKSALVSLFINKVPKYVEEEFRINFENILIVVPGCNFVIIYFLICTFFLSILASKQSKKEKDKYLKNASSFNNIFFLILAYLIGFFL